MPILNRSKTKTLIAIAVQRLGEHTPGTSELHGPDRGIIRLLPVIKPSHTDVTMLTSVARAQSSVLAVFNGAYR
ncbi:hypothetical protein AO391_19770 [Pseudomonas marginalis ICMP 9505]|uniref:hypothetical protein n=1 Tax=Pseudomonas kitaguniensis TaxID=2607908 RepID=UPI0007309DB2|nr:hypothetical protein [Pseudomonas kitaguniensis]KTC12050.1 hypothetical protein AO391_19770 [Pseudomonas marginalis ICMP 9505]